MKSLLAFPTRAKRLMVILAMALAGCTGASGALFTLTTTDSVVSGQRNEGWWSPTVAHSQTNYLYLVGNFGAIGGPYNQYRSHMSFNLASVTAPIVSAQLQLTRFASVGRETTDGLGVPINDINSGVSQTLSIFDVTTDAVTLNTFNGISSAIYNDLGSGAQYGTYTESQAWAPDGVITVNLNAAAIAAINANHGAFSVGITLNAGNTQNSYMFGGTGGAYNGTQALVLSTVPEPGTGCLCAVAAGVFLFSRRRAKARTTY